MKQKKECRVCQFKDLGIIQTEQGPICRVCYDLKGIKDEA